MPSLSRDALIREARAKITWGTSATEVLLYLQAGGLGDKEAYALIDDLMSERSAQIRSDALRKILIGSALMLCPVVVYFFGVKSGSLSLKGFSATVVLGLGGLWKLMDGLIMMFGAKKWRGGISNLNPE